MTEPLKVCVEVDLAVAEAAKLSVYPADGHRLHVEVFIAGVGGARRVFSPTTCMDDAIEAAEAVGLFRAHGATLWHDGQTWCVSIPDRLYPISEATVYRADTMELASCEAILAVTEKGEGGR